MITERLTIFVFFVGLVIVRDYGGGVGRYTLIDVDGDGCEARGGEKDLLVVGDGAEGAEEGGTLVLGERLDGTRRNEGGMRREG